MDKDERVILGTISVKTPRAMQAVKDRFDEGLVMKNGEIKMDFRKLFGSNDGEKSDKEHQMLLFKALKESHFQEYIEHPLCQAFIDLEFERVKKLFLMVFILPSILYAGN